MGRSLVWGRRRRRRQPARRARNGPCQALRTNAGVLVGATRAWRVSVTSRRRGDDGVVDPTPRTAHARSAVDRCSMIRNLREPRHSAHCASPTRCARVAVLSPMLGPSEASGSLDAARAIVRAAQSAASIGSSIEPADLEDTVRSRGRAVRCISGHVRGPSLSLAARKDTRRARDRSTRTPTSVLSARHGPFALRAITRKDLEHDLRRIRPLALAHPRTRSSS